MAFVLLYCKLEVYRQKKKKKEEERFLKVVGLQCSNITLRKLAPLFFTPL